jgi:hypothetical protein
VLTTPKDSPLQLGPSGFRPTVHLEGKYLAIAIGPDVAQSALGAARSNTWKPSEEVVRACRSVPEKLNLLSLIDVSESLPPLLASFPGTLQTMINTAIAVSNSRASGSQANAGAAPGAAVGAGSRPPGGRFGRGRGGAFGGDDEGSRAGGAGFRPQGGSAAPSAGTGSGSEASSEEMIVLRVDSDLLPKVEDVKARLFPSTLAINVSEQDVRFAWRAAFPDLGFPIELAPLVASLPAVRQWGERLRQMAADATNDAAATAAGSSEGPAPQSPPAAGAQAAGKSQAPAAPPGRGRGGRNRRTED